jgi:hypothetical protein
MRENYYLYWLNADGSRTFYLNEELGTNAIFETYQDLYTAGQGLTPPAPDSRLQFGVVKL